MCQEKRIKYLWKLNSTQFTHRYINLFHCIQHFTNNISNLSSFENIRIDRVHYLQSAFRPHIIVRNAEIKKRWNTDKVRLPNNVVRNTRIMDDGFAQIVSKA